jgi:putative transposase
MAQRTYKYRIYPTKSQENNLNNTLEECRCLYNHFLEERIHSYKNLNISLSLYDQHAKLTNLKKENPNLLNVHSQVLQNVGVRLDLAFKSFFRRVKVKQKVGFPRFKSFGRYTSFTYPDSGFKFKGSKLYLSKLGNFKIKLHRPILGLVKTCTISKSSTGKWFACFSCEVNNNLLDSNNNSIGIDVGIESFATFSNGEKINNPRFFKKEESSLSKAQRKCSLEKDKRKKTSLKRRIACIHERIKNKRHNFVHQESRKIINKFGKIFIEDLTINRMVNSYYAKSIYDASWNQFFNCLLYKAEDAGRVLLKINPAYTSQDCSNCGYREPKKLSDRIHKCKNCYLSMDRDLNASLNILRLGLQSLGESP